VNLHEYQAKTAFARHGIPTPCGMVVTSPQDAYDTARELEREAAIDALHEAISAQLDFVVCITENIML
jgi:succinyl-CoA synthetase beta subunit